MELEGFGTFLFIVVASTLFIFLMSRDNHQAATTKDEDEETAD